MLTAQQIADFHRDGFLAIRGVFQGAELKALQEAASKVTEEGIAQQGHHHQYREFPNGSKVYYRSEWMWERDPIFRAATVNPTLLEAIAQCIGHPFMPVNDSFVCKLPRGNVPIEWHQDPPYGFMGKKEEHTLDIPNFDTDIYLDHSTIENGCVWGIPGHHLVGSVDLEKYTQEELFEKFGAKPMIMEPGDVLFHCLSAPHGSIGNKTDTTRRIFYVHYMCQRVIEESYKGWFPDKERGRGWNPTWAKRIQDFVQERVKLGYTGLEGSRVHWNQQAFEFIGQPTTPPDHWPKLIAAITPQEKARKKRLEPVLAMV